jgi:Ni,Fe-hydrogenase III component G
MILAALLDKGDRVPGHRPWQRAIVSAEIWRDAVGALANGSVSLLGFWGDENTVHMALLDEETVPNSVAVLSLACPDRAFPSVGVSHPPAIRLERAIRDLFGLVPTDAPDARPWFDHGRWGDSHHANQAGEPYPFLPSRASICTRFQSVRFMPGSSSRVISVSPQAARPSYGWSSVWVTCTRALNL